MLSVPPAFVLSQDQTLYKFVLYTSSLICYNLFAHSFKLANVSLYFFQSRTWLSFQPVHRLRFLCRLGISRVHFWSLFLALFNFQDFCSRSSLGGSVFYSITFIRICQVLFQNFFVKFSLRICELGGDSYSSLHSLFPALSPAFPRSLARLTAFRVTAYLYYHTLFLLSTPFRWFRRLVHYFLPFCSFMSHFG